MAPSLARWPLLRSAQPRSAQTRVRRLSSDGVPRPDRLLRDNPVLVLSGLQSPESVAALVASWNPAAMLDGARSGVGAGFEVVSGDAPDTSPRYVADGVRWHGPFRLTPMLRADAGLAFSGTAGIGDAASSGGVAYVAEARRERVKIADGRQAELLRMRYPHGVPSGAEADAWHLVRGLARRLRGTARLPGCPPYSPCTDPRAAVAVSGDDDLRVFSHEMLPWPVLKEILRPLSPGLSREALPDGGGYILRERGVLEVSVRPADAHTDKLPYAIRDRADDAWPHSVYEFRTAHGGPDGSSGSGPEGIAKSGVGTLGSFAASLTSPASPSAPAAKPIRLRTPATNAASLIAEITGGLLLDADGFLAPLRQAAYPGG